MSKKKQAAAALKAAETKQRIRDAAESDLATFIKLVAPHRVLGSIHEELCQWWEREDAKSHQLTLLPRDHGKSAMIAYRVAWYITKFPDIRVLYISSTSNLAEKQLKFIKDILTSDNYSYYWPEMVNKEEGKREKWTNTEIAVDHPKRKEEGVRDSTIFTGGLTTSLTGLHCDIAVLDDIVVYENAMTKEGRTKVKSQYSLLSSIEGGEAREWVVGTRYHPKDIYSEMLSMKQDIYDEEGLIVDEEPIYEIFERAVEDKGDGTGQFLWPRQQRHDGKWFGFDRGILAKKRAQYLDRAQFRAQYYNNPNNPDGAGISRSKFQYFEKAHVKRRNGVWYYKERRLNIYAAMDFAYSVRKTSDYTALVVIGMDYDNNAYVLDIERIKTDKISDYFRLIQEKHVQWDFRKLRAEMTSGGRAVVQELKNNYIKRHGLALSVDEHVPNRHQGSKEERMAAILEPRYDNLQVWHYQGGNCQILEDELLSEHPPHDDVKDALASCLEIAVPPRADMRRHESSSVTQISTHPRFGGVSFG